MSNFKHDVLLRIVKFINVILITLPFAFSWGLYYNVHMEVPFFLKGRIIVIALFVVFYILFGRIYDAFLVSIYRISEMIYSQSLAALIADAFMYIVFILLYRRLPNVLPLLGVFACQLILSIFWSRAAHKWYFHVFPAKKSAIVYDMRPGLDKLVSKYGLEKKFDILKQLTVSECLQDLDQLQGLETVFLSGIRSHERNIILKYCVANGIDLYLIPRVGDVIMSGAKNMHLFHLPMMRVGRYNPSPGYLISKRVFDIFVSLVCLIILSPVFLVTAIAIKATDGGPVFYKQERLTKDGKHFMIHKFRSMRVDAEKDGVARLSTGDRDDRITPVGRIIRKIRLDELPQLLDILSGDLSIVGPRPERPQIAEMYEKIIPEFRLRLQVKAGLTGYAQVYGQYNTTPYDKLQMDLMYIAHPSFLEDLRICFTTIKILFMPESTDGIEEGQTTAMDYRDSADSTGKDTDTVKK